MQVLSIDIETFSSVDIKSSGMYKYVESPDFEILLFAYSFNDNPVHIIDLAAGEELPGAVVQALQDPRCLKTAHNAAFERACIRQFFKLVLPVNQWQCTMMKSSMLGLPLSLDMVAKVLKLEQQKESTGKALIRYFCMPCKPTKANGMRTRNLPADALDKWEEFKGYCVQDVVVEKSIKDKIHFFTIPDSEIRLWQLDQKINDNGVLLDPVFVNNAIAMDDTNKERLLKEAVELTKLNNPNSAAQLKAWLSEETGLKVDSLTKEATANLLKENTDTWGPEIVNRVLTIRQEMSKTSVKKYSKMLLGLCLDNRLKGIHQFYGANRTGRWAGRLVQPQNLPKNYLNDLDLARQLVRSGDIEMTEMLFGNVPDTLSQLIRTAFVCPTDSRLIAADFSAIEARVIAWLAGEKWRLDVFNTHGKIYEASAAQMFKVPIASITKGSDLRQKGKVSELALGYQGGPSALITMGALKMGIAEDELPKLVKMWRNANPAIVKLWYTVGDAALKAVATGVPVQIMYGIRFSVEHNILFITLPSGRRLAYMHPTIIDGKFGDALNYEGMDQTSKQWCRQDTYGGKLVENIVQAIARDCLAEAMMRLDTAGYKIVLHIHDEAVLEVPNGSGSLAEVNRIMSTPMPWAKGLPLGAESYETQYYKKD